MHRMNVERSKSITSKHLIQVESVGSEKHNRSKRAHGWMGWQATRAAILLALYLVLSFLTTRLAPPVQAWPGLSQQKEKTAKQGEKVSKQEAECEKLKVGGDVPVVAWTDTSVQPWAAVLCLHGLGLHKESFIDLGKRLSRVGVLTYAIDVRGFGAWLETKSLNRVDFGQAVKD